MIPQWSPETCFAANPGVTTLPTSACSTVITVLWKHVILVKFVLDLKRTRYNNTANYRFECPETLFTAGLIEGCTRTVQELCYESVMTQDDPELRTDLFQVY